MTKHDKPAAHHKNTAHSTRQWTKQQGELADIWDTTYKKHHIKADRVGRQKERMHSLTSQTVMFTLLKCTGSCDLQKKQFQFSGQFFPKQTIIAMTMNYH